MKKKLYFTSNANSMKEANTVNTFVNFVYDTKTGELKLVDSFGGEIKELVLGTAAPVNESDDSGSDTPEP